MYQHITVPADGEKITVTADGLLNVPDHPVIPFIEGDGTGADITPVMIRVVDAAVEKAYGGARKNVLENIAVSANGSRVRLFRDVANIAMDMNGIENLALSTLGGADVVTVNDLTGTNLKRADINLGATGGSGDGQPDIVIANGTEGPDRVQVGTVEGNVVVTGLPAQLQVSGSESANDGLQINTLGGKDSVSVATGVNQRINPSVDLGADQ